MSNYINVYFIGEVVAASCNNANTFDAAMTFTTTDLNIDADNKFILTPTSVGRRNGLQQTYYGKVTGDGTSSFENLSTNAAAGEQAANPFSFPLDGTALYGFTINANNGDYVVVRTTSGNSITDFVDYPASSAGKAGNQNKTPFFRGISNNASGFSSVKLSNLPGASMDTVTANIAVYMSSDRTLPTPGKSYITSPSGPIDVTGAFQTLMEFTVGRDDLAFGEDIFGSRAKPTETGTGEFRTFADSIINTGQSMFIAITPNELSLTGPGSWITGKYCVGVDIECVINP